MMRWVVRWLGLSAMLGGALWLVSWVCNAFTEDGTQAVLGLSERGWRRLLDPVLLSFIAVLGALYSIQARQLNRAGRAGLVIALVGLATFLIGNVIEFWVGPLLYRDHPGFSPADHLGWSMVLSGYATAVMGLALWGVSTVRAQLWAGWSRAAPLLVGVVPVLMVIIGVAMELMLDTRAAAVVGGGGLIFSFGVGWILLGYVLWTRAVAREEIVATRYAE